MRGERVDYTCQHCGKIFSWLKSQGMRKHCSQVCKNAMALHVTMNCPGCSTTFSVLQSQMTEGRTYCSLNCKRSHTHEKLARVCEACEKEFQTYHSTDVRRFCSIPCSRRVLGSPKHVDGRTRHPHYARWYNMVRRCTNPSDPNYRHYGSRGISVCEEWRTPANFYRYLDEVLGPCPGTYSLDRIDVDRDYEPGNVRWASKLEQYRNRRPFMVDPSGQKKYLK